MSAKNLPDGTGAFWFLWTLKIKKNKIIPTFTKHHTEEMLLRAEYNVEKTVIPSERTKPS